jgi:hypothetical protein
LQFKCVFKTVFLSTIGFSQTIHVDTFKTRKDFEIKRYYDMNGNLFIVIDEPRWLKYERDTLPTAIKQQRLKFKARLRKHENK